MWGRLVTFRYVQPADEAGEGPDTKELAASGRRIGLAAVCLAVIIPMILPTGRARDVFGTTATGKPHGVGAGLDAFLKVQRQLNEQPQQVLTYTTNAADPAQQYLQVFVLNYSARRNMWLPLFPTGVGGVEVPVGTTLPYKPTGQLSTTPVTTVRTKVRVDGGQGGPTAYLPVPYAPVDLRIGGVGWEELSGSLMILSPVQGLSGLRYTVTSREAVPTPADINKPNGQFVPGPIQAAFGNYSGPDANKLLTIARAHTQGALTQLQAATDLQNWLLSRAFTYTLKPNLPASSHWLLSFLTTHRRGYCQQFAWALAVLARLVGIPSRVVVGYTGGSTTGHGIWQVTTTDAHAWPQLYFPGQGWLRFEPTPHAAGGQGTATVPRYASGPSTGPNSPLPGGQFQGQTSPGAGAGTSKKSGALNRITQEHSAAGGALAGRSDVGLWLGIGIPVLIILLLTWPALVRLLTRRRRLLTSSGDAAQARAAWRELTDDLSDYGLGCAPGETPRVVAGRVTAQASLDPAAALAIKRIADAKERATLCQAGLAGRRAERGPADAPPGDRCLRDAQAATPGEALASIYTGLGPAAAGAGQQHARLAGFIMARSAAAAATGRPPIGVARRSA